MTCTNSNIFSKSFFKAFKPFLYNCIQCGEKYNKLISKNTGEMCRTCHNYQVYIKRNDFISFSDYKIYLKNKESRSIEIINDKNRKINKNNKKNDLTSSGLFLCTVCNKERDLAIREKNRTRCGVCGGYKSHKNRFKDKCKRYEEYEYDYLNRKEFNKGDKKKCVSCLKVKSKDDFNKRSGGHCLSCWFGDEQAKVRRLRKTMREPFRRNSTRVFQDTFGYSFDDLINHLSLLFTDGMTIEKIYSSEIHIDHIIPASAFDHNNRRHVEYCWSLKNLQPLWAHDNQIKHDYLINGERVSDIRRRPNHREILNDILRNVYNLDI